MKFLLTKTLLLALPGAAFAAPFGADLFQGGFSRSSVAKAYPEYLLKNGDTIEVSLFGSLQANYSLTVDAVGNVVIPKVGPIKVAGVKLSELNTLLKTSLRSTYNESVSIYATLAVAQPVRVSVVGEVLVPGQYAGLSSDNILRFLDQAGGVSAQGSYRDIKVIRSGQVVQRFDLYEIRQTGQFPAFYFTEADSVHVSSRQDYVTVAGLSGFVGELELHAGSTLEDVRRFASPIPGVTHVNLTRVVGGAKRSIIYPIDSQAPVARGDHIEYVNESISRSFSVTLSMNDGTQKSMIASANPTLARVLTELQIPQSQWNQIRLFRPSLAKKQQDSLAMSLSALEQATYTARSATAEESAVKSAEAELVSRLISTAKSVQPVGQVRLGGFDLNQFQLEPGDRLELASSSSVISVTGSVLAPGSFLSHEAIEVSEALARTGGTLQDESDLIYAAVSISGETRRLDQDSELRPGDELLVIPKVKTKNVELSRAISTVLYQIAFSAKVVLGL